VFVLSDLLLRFASPFVLFSLLTFALVGGQLKASGLI
jgi:hypothetical protein